MAFILPGPVLCQSLHRAPARVILSYPAEEGGVWVRSRRSQAGGTTCPGSPGLLRQEPEEGPGSPAVWGKQSRNQGAWAGFQDLPRSLACALGRSLGPRSQSPSGVNALSQGSRKRLSFTLHTSHMPDTGLGSGRGCSLCMNSVRTSRR